MKNENFNFWLNLQYSTFFERSGFTILNRSVSAAFGLDSRAISKNNILFFTNDHQDYMNLLRNHHIKGLFLLMTFYKGLLILPRPRLEYDEESGFLKIINENERFDIIFHKLLSEELLNYNPVINKVFFPLHNFNLFLFHYVRFCKVRSLLNFKK
jgi:hypothetical protein